MLKMTTHLVVLLLACAVLTAFVIPQVSSQQQQLTEYETFLAEFTRSHFTEFGPKLRMRAPVGATTSPYLDSLLFPRKDRHKRVKRDADFNAKILERHFGKMSEFVAGRKRDAIQSSLISSGIALQTELDELKAYSESLLLPHFTDNIALLDTDKRVELLPARSNRHEFRSLVLGLNALLVARLNHRATRAVFELNHIAAVDPAEYDSFKGYKSTKIAINVTSAEQQQRRRLQPQNTGEVNWVSAGAVGPVQNQGSCGGCWSFAATAVMASRLVVANQGNLTVLSQQQLVSCSSSNGCAGGEYQEAWDYANTVGGLVTGAQYPYSSGNGDSNTCIQSETTTPVVTAGDQDGNPLTEQQLRNAVASGGPVAIAIATPSCFHYYASGILTPQDCPSGCFPGNPIDHAVTVVGYGTQQGVGFWQIQNSWGPNWGMDGYILFEAGVSPAGMCGLMTDPSYPTTVSLSTECQAPKPPSYCIIIEPVLYSNVNGTSDVPGMCVQNPAGIFVDKECTQTEGGYVVPTWAWVLLGIALALIALIAAWCVYAKCFASKSFSPAKAAAPPAVPENVVLGTATAPPPQEVYGVERV